MRYHRPQIIYEGFRVQRYVANAYYRRTWVTIDLGAFQIYRRRK